MRWGLIKKDWQAQPTLPNQGKGRDDKYKAWWDTEDEDNSKTSVPKKNHQKKNKDLIKIV